MKLQLTTEQLRVIECIDWGYNKKQTCEELGISSSKLNKILGELRENWSGKETELIQLTNQLLSPPNASTEQDDMPSQYGL